MKRLLLIWWAGCLTLSAVAMRNAPVAFLATAIAGATVFAILLLRCSPSRPWVRLSVYLSAVLANLTTAITAAFWPLLPGHRLHPVPNSAAGLMWTLGSVATSVATFLLVRTWVSRGRRCAVPRRQWPWRQTLGAGFAAAAIFMLTFVMSDHAWQLAQLWLHVEPTHFPHESGEFSAWFIATATGGLAGAVEEPVIVGLVVLLWPRPRIRTFIALALLSGVVRTGIHLYYAAGAANVALALALIALWCISWSSVSLLLIYRTRMLWPVVVAHGLNNYVATLSGPFTADVTPLNVVVVGTPLVAILAIGMVGIIYGIPRGVDSLDRVITQRWPKLNRSAESADT